MSLSKLFEQPSITAQKCRNSHIQYTRILAFNNGCDAYLSAYCEPFLFVIPALADESIHDPGVYHGEAAIVGLNTSFMMFFLLNVGIQCHLQPMKNT